MDKRQDPELTTLPLAAVQPDPDQPRKHFDRVALDELAASIAAQGLLEPIIVRPIGWSVLFDDRGRTAGPLHYQIVAGERRWRAAQIAGLETIPAIVRGDLDNRSALVLQIIENVLRADMNPMEEARAYQRLIETGLTVAEVSQQLGKAQSEITYRLRLLDLAPAIQDLVAAGQMPVWHGALVSRLSTEGQYRIMRAAANGELRYPKDIDRLVAAIELQETQGELFEQVPTVSVEQVRAAKALRTMLEEIVASISKATNLAGQANPRAAELEMDSLLAEEIRRSSTRLAAAVHEHRAVQMAISA